MPAQVKGPEERRRGMRVTLEITDAGGHHASYRVVPARNSEGQPCWLLDRRRPDDPSQVSRRYVVTREELSPGAWTLTCTCPAGSQGQRCKHRDALLVLLGLTAATSPD